MATSADAVFSALAATSRVRRCHNPFFRQQLLKQLHDILRKNTSELKGSIKQDTGVSDVEATAEIAYTLNIVKEHYSSISPEKELEEEYRIAKGNNAQDHQIPYGVVYIEPRLDHTPLFSTVSPISAAVAAGNCVVVKIENSLLNTTTLLRNLLPQALEPDIFGIVSAAPETTSLGSAAQVYQNGHDSSKILSTQLVSPERKVVAIVDRTADLSSAAESLISARFAFGGTSPYAPDLVLVNEFVEKDFVSEVLRKAVRYFNTPSQNGNGSVEKSNRTGKASKISSRLKLLGGDKNWSLNILAQGDSGAVVKVSARSQHLVPLPPRTAEPILVVSTTSSLDHAIDLILNDSDEPLLAAYHFAAPSHAKYLSQSVSADVSFVNHIPLPLLLGPSAPAFRAFDLEKRYAKEHFTKGQPSFITSNDRRVVELEGVVGETTGSKKLDALLKSSTQEIKEKKRDEWIAIGFFEQGIFIGLGVYGIPLLTCIGASIFFGVRFGLRKWAVL